MKAYMVMKMVQPINIFSMSESVFGCLGLVPIFRTIEEADEHAGNGKFDIVMIDIPGEQEPAEA